MASTFPHASNRPRAYNATNASRTRFRDDPDTIYEDDENEVVELYKQEAYYVAERPSAWKFLQLVVVGSLTIFILGLCVFFGFHAAHTATAPPAAEHVEHKLAARSNQQPLASPELCTTPACINLAATILNNMSPKKDVDPCSNFNEFVCGGFGDHHSMRADQSSTSTSSVMDDTTDIILRAILSSSEEPARTTGTTSKNPLVDTANFKALKTTFDACMNEAHLADVGLTPLQEQIRLSRAVYPGSKNGSRITTVIQQNAQNTESAPPLGEILGWLDDHGIGSLVRLGNGADDRHPDVVVTGVYTACPAGLPAKEQYKDAKVFGSYRDTIAAMFDIVLDDSIKIPGGKSNKELGYAVADFEKAIAATCPKSEDESDVTKYYNVYSLSDLNAMVPQLGLEQVIRSRTPANVTNDRIIVSFPDSLRQLSVLLDKTPEDTLTAYVTWKQISSFGSYLSRDLIKPMIRFNNKLNGLDPDTKPERWRTCLGYVSGRLGWFLSKYYVEKTFSEEAKAEGNQIVRDIRTQYVDVLNNAEWMDKSVREEAIKKVHNIGQKIGFPDKSPDLLDPESLQRWYYDLNFTNDYFTNMLSSRYHSSRKDWASLAKPVDRDEWGMVASEINAYYSPNGNEIVFPAGIMQPPVFHADFPSYINFGAFGSVSGHELSHGFDNSGRHYDEIGNYTDWWDNKTIAAFEERTTCFVDQYAKFSVEGTDGKPLHVNGQLTLGENLADIGGLKASFAAWNARRMTSRKVEQSLPGLDKYTHEQMFFISYGNWWCGEQRPEYSRLLIYSDPHSPNWARVDGTTANSVEFLKAFNCPKKEATCTLW